MSNPLDVHLLDGYGDPNDSMTHDGVRYNLNKIRKAVYYFPRQLFKVKDMEWLLDECPWTEEDEARLAIINPRRPIFVTIWEGKLCNIDGYHRLKLAHRQGKKWMVGILVTEKVLKQCQWDIGRNALNFGDM